MKRKYLVRLDDGKVGHAIVDMIQQGELTTAFTERADGSRLEFTGRVAKILATLDLSRRERLREAQAALDMDDSDLAALLQIDQSTVAGWVRGKTEAPGSCVRLAETLAWFHNNQPTAWDAWIAAGHGNLNPETGNPLTRVLSAR